MAECHEIRNGFHVCQPSMDFGRGTQGYEAYRVQVGIQEKDWSKWLGRDLQGQARGKRIQTKTRD